jgi:hypothetical protein
MKIIGVIVILWSFADLGLSLLGTDLYWVIGINLPDWLYMWTFMITLVIGAIFFTWGTHKEDEV